MKFREVLNVPKIHTTPLATLRIECPKVTVELDDVDERRLRLSFHPYQAVRLVTADCFRVPAHLSIIPNRVAEVLDSPWKAELEEALFENDHSASFLTKAHHYLVPLQDDFLEVVAWSIRVDSILE